MTSGNLVNAAQAVNSSTFDAALFVLIVAVIVSLIIGMWSIVLTKNIEARKYKYELLKEIVDWLESVCKCGGEICLRFMKTKLITPDEEKSIAEEAVAKYLLVSSKADFILNIANSAGVPSELFNGVNNGIADVMRAINEQIESKKVNISVLYDDHIGPLNGMCSELMGIIAKTLSREVKLKRSEFKILNNDSETENKSDNG